MGRLVIYGAGGQGRDLLMATRDDPREIVFISDEPVPPEFGLAVIDRSDLRDDDAVVIAISDGRVRRRLAATLANITQVVAPTALLPRGWVFGEGTIICDFVGLVPHCSVGRHVHINTYCYIGHDSVVDDFATLAPRVSINGNVHVAEGAYIGSGALIHQGEPGRPLTIGRNAIVGMGAVVTRDVPDNCVVVGNPARVVRYFPDPDAPA